MKTLTLAVTLALVAAQAARAGEICPPGTHQECSGEPLVCSCFPDSPPPPICNPGEWRACAPSTQCGVPHEQQCISGGYAWGRLHVSSEGSNASKDISKSRSALSWFAAGSTQLS